jgi:hypothetical protein
MNKFKIQGTITEIGEKKVLDGGAVVLTYVVEQTSDNGFVTPFAFEMYNKADKAEFTDKFLEYNKVGNNVEVEFTVRGRLYNGRTYNSFNHWNISNVSEVPTENAEEIQDLPF